MTEQAQAVVSEPSLHEKLMAVVRSPAYVAEEAQRRKLQETCAHVGWDFKKHGRCCGTCGAFVVDFGD